MTSERDLGSCQEYVNIPLRMLTDFVKFMEDDGLGVIKLANNHLFLLLSERFGFGDLDDCQWIPFVRNLGEDVKCDILKLKLLCHSYGR